MKVTTKITIHEFPEKDGSPHPNSAIVIQQDFEHEDRDIRPSEPLDPQIIAIALEEEMAFQAMCEVGGLNPEHLGKDNGLYYQTVLGNHYDGSNILLAISNKDGGFSAIAEFSQFALYMTSEELEKVFDFCSQVWE
jgi:hypothetical protein